MSFLIPDPRLVRVEIPVRLDQLRAELACIPAMTSEETKALVERFKQEIKAAERAARIPRGVGGKGRTHYSGDTLDHVWMDWPPRPEPRMLPPSPVVAAALSITTAGATRAGG